MMSHDPAWRCRMGLGYLVVALGLGLTLGPVGCSDDPEAQVSGDPKPGEPKPRGQSPQEPEKVTPAKFREAFLAAVEAGKAEPKHFTEGFLKLIAPDGDGYDGDAVNEWLARFKGGEFKPGKPADIPGGQATRGSVTGLERIAHFGLCVRADGGEPKVDWFWPTPVKCVESPYSVSRDVVAAADFASHFLDTLMAGNVGIPVAEKMMSPEVKRRIVGADDGESIDQGWLRAKLGKFAGPSYTLSNPQPGDGGKTVTFEVKMADATATLTVTEGEAGWSVTALKKG